MKLATALTLGRVSNLPTVWSNVLAGIALAGVSPTPGSVIILSMACSMFYVGGMFLNDAFDASIDRIERPKRPIPAGDATVSEVAQWGARWLAAGLVVLVLHGLWLGGPTWAPLAAGIATCIVIVVYNVHHKQNPWAPFIMGLCRVGVYLVSAVAVAPELPAPVFIGAVLLLGYVLGLTYVARYENQSRLGRSWPLVGLFAPLAYGWPLVRAPLVGRLLLAAFGLWTFRGRHLVKKGGPSIRSAVVSLIAGISLLDAMLIIRTGQVIPACAALGAFGLTLFLQRYISGT